MNALFVQSLFIKQNTTTVDTMASTGTILGNTIKTNNFYSGGNTTSIFSDYINLGTNETLSINLLSDKMINTISTSLKIDANNINIGTNSTQIIKLDANEIHICNNDVQIITINSDLLNIGSCDTQELLINSQIF